MSAPVSSLYWACHRGQKNSVLKLINYVRVRYVKPFQVSGDTPLHQACKQGWLDIVNLFIEEYGCDPNVINIYHQSPLYYACQYGHKKVVEYLLYEQHVTLNPRRVGNTVHVLSRHDTFLHQVCRHGWLDIVKLFIEEYGCDPNVTNKYQSPLYYACQYGHKKVVEYLLYEQHVTLNPRRVGNTVHVNRHDTFLHQVCRYGWLDIVKLFIEEYGCDPNVTNKYQSPLYYACQYGHKKVVEYLLCEQHVNPRRFRNTVHVSHHDTFLHKACRHGWLDIVKLSIEKYGCDPNVTNWSNQSPLHYACQYGHIRHVVEYLVNEQHVNPLLMDKSGLEPLDYALNNNKTDIAIYICQQCITSDELLNPNRIKTTVNLIESILKADPFDPKWKTANGGNILQLVGSSKSCILRVPSAVVLKILNTGSFKNIAFQPDWRTGDGDKLLELVCQSEKYLSHTTSALILKWLDVVTIDHVKVSIPDSKTADGKILIQLVCQSQMCIAHVSTTVLSKWLRDSTSLSLEGIFVLPGWKTADGDTLLQLICQSEMIVSQMSSAVLLKLLKDATLDINLAKIIIPEWKTADRDTLLQLVFQSETIVSRISSPVFSKWLEDTTLDVNLAKIIVLEWKTADGDTFLQLVLQSETIVSRISSPVLSKWLEDTTLDVNLAKIIVPEWKTADGDTFLQLVLQSETIVSRISSPVLSKLLKGTTLDVNLAKIIIPEWKTANGDSLLQLVFEISTNQMKMVDPNRKRLDGDHFLYAICQSTTDDKRLIKLMQCCIKEYPGILDSNGNTALHIACQADKPALVSFLLNEAKCDPSIKNKKKSLPLDMTTNPKVINYLCQHDQVAVVSERIAQWMYNRSIDDAKMLCILKALVNNHRYRTKDGSTLLHITCYTYVVFRDKIKLIHYLLTEGHCDPNSLDSKGQMPLQLISDSKIMQLLIEHGAKMTTDVVFKVISSGHISHSRAIELFTLSAKKGTMVWNTHDLNSNDETALHLACKRDKPTIVNYLLTEAKCDPNAYQCPPLESTTNFEIAKMLIEHGARVTPKIVLRFEAMEVINNDYKVIQLMLTTCSWSPDDKDSDGYTALHLACKAGSPTTVNRLLSVAHCDPNIKSNNEEVPLQMTTNPEIIKDLIRHGAKTSIMYESCQNSLGTNEPVKPPVKVFVVGNPSVGKSSLTAILKKRLNIVARLFTSGKVSGVDQKTVGIVPHEVESNIYGRVTLYDFAGHREFYSGHAALLQTAIQSTPPVFLLVVNLYQDDHAITKDVMYWISFLENQCASVNCKPHIILVGSHADSLKSSGINAKDKIKAIVDSLDTKCFMNMELVGFVAIDCQYHQSLGMSDLRSLLIKSCNELRIHEPITFNAHCFLVYLIDTFTNSPAVTINTIYITIENQLESQVKESVLEFLPRNFEALYKICIELNDRGHILLLKDRIAVENSYIVIDKEFLLSKISGTVFAPEGFKQYKQLSTNTGVVSLSRIAECFPDKDLNILTGFLTHLEFCHEISDQALHQLISEQYSRVSGERYYLFPGLISIKADDTVWKLQSKYDYNFGWILKCIHLEQFFSSRFLQVLLLRLAFSFALETCDNPNQSIGIHRNCYLWKNGIFWGSGFRMQTLVEVTPDNKSVIVLARFRKVKLLQCVQHRSNVINTILQCKKQFCPRVLTTESFVDSSSSLQYPINLLANELTICTLQDLATAVVNESSVVLQCDEIDAENFLSFEPYLEMKSSTIHELWDEKNEKKVISERFLSTFAEQASEKLTLIIGILIGNSASSTRDDQLYQILLKWRDGDMNNQKTYRDLRQIVDQYSVFAGRNVLVSTDWSIMYAIA